jgi:hypothetical protein
MNTKKLKKTLSKLLLMVIGASVGFMAAKIGLDSAKTASTAQIVTFIILFLPVFFLVVGVHEAGHAIAGKLVDFDFRIYVVGPFMWDKEETGWKFKWNKNVNVSGGLVICIPTTTENLAKRFSIYSLGGPAASFVLTAFAYGTKLLLGFINTNQNPVLSVTESLFALTSFLSLLIFIITIIPLHSGGFYTDGARALRFLGGGDTARFETLLMKIISSACGGIRPRHLNKDEINEVLMLANNLDSPMKVYVLYYMYHFAFDEGKYDEAEGYLKEYIANVESIPKGMRGSVFLDAAFFYAFTKKDLAQAENYWKQYEPSALIPKAQVLSTEAALCHLKGKNAIMITKIELALSQLPNMMDRGASIVLREQLTELKNLNHTPQIG